MILRKAEIVITTAIAGLVPWLAPIPTAFSVYQAGIRSLAWPSWVAILGALAVEGLGMAATATALDIYSYQQSKRKTDADASNELNIAILASMLYLFCTFVIIALLETSELVGPKRFVPLVFPFLSLSGVIILALRSSHAKRMQSIEDSKLEKRQTKKSKPESEPEKPELQRLTFVQFMELRKHKKITAKMLISEYGIKRSTAYDWMKKAEVTK